MRNSYNLPIIDLLKFLYSGKSQGISEKEIENAEKRLKIKIPETLKNYYIQCGNLKINYCFNYILEPKDLGFSHDWERENLKYDDISNDEIEKELAKIPNMLIFWCENQGVWNAGIKKEDLCLKSPLIYMTTNDDLISWEKITDDVESFIMGQIIANIPDSEFSYKYFENEDVEKILENGSILKTILLRTNFKTSYADKFSSYVDCEKNLLYLFMIDNTGKILYGYIVEAKK